MENQKFTELIENRRMRAFPPPPRSDAKKFLIRLSVIQFFLACRVKTSPTYVRPAKILNISAFRDFFTETFSGNPEELREVG